jgi:hypothetical protein
MANKQKQKEKEEYYWHVHHAKPFEKSTEPIETRINYIKINKPKDEIETRLRLMHPVKNVRAVLKALEEYNAVKSKAWKEYNAVKSKARKESELKKLHDKECPNCPWDGNTIFPTNKNSSN